MISFSWISLSCKESQEKGLSLKEQNNHTLSISLVCSDDDFFRFLLLLKLQEDWVFLPLLLSSLFLLTTNDSFIKKSPDSLFKSLYNLILSLNDYNTLYCLSTIKSGQNLRLSSNKRIEHSSLSLSYKPTSFPHSFNVMKLSSFSRFLSSPQV